MPYQEGKPLSPIAEEGAGDTVPVDYTTSHDEHSSEQHIFMATIGDPNEDQYANEQLENISADELTGNGPQNKDEEHRRAWRMRNTKCAQHRQNTAWLAPDNLNLAISKELLWQLMTVNILLPWGTSLKPPSCCHDFPRTRRLKGRWS